MQELVVISGKGGTGKTSIAASFAALDGNKVLADCDVDAADLHLILEPTVRHSEAFYSGNEAVIRTEDCVGCGACLARCRFDAVRMDGDRAVFLAQRYRARMIILLGFNFNEVGEKLGEGGDRVPLTREEEDWKFRKLAWASILLGFVVRPRVVSFSEKTSILGELLGAS